jgi:hypothetical protein
MGTNFAPKTQPVTAKLCSREDSNLHGLPHTVLSRTRLPIPPRERAKTDTIGEIPVVKRFAASPGSGSTELAEVFRA